MKDFSISIKGRVKNFSLPKNQPLIPVFEAIVNSIHSIEERKSIDKEFNDGTINIYIERDNSQTTFLNILPPINSFKIVDNGIGFNDNNIESFSVSDSTYKEKIGGKGVGRFSWLLAFEKAEIESIYKEKGEVLKRCFSFSVDSDGIDDRLYDFDGEYSDNLTSIVLRNYKSDYRENVPKNTKTIAMRIIEHCLVYFISSECPHIILNDNLGEGRVDLNKVFQESIKTDENHGIFSIGNEKFEILHVKVEDKSVNGNKLYLCANNRVVLEKDLDKYIVDLDRTIYDNHEFYYIGVLSSRYLDSNVDMNRLSFNISENGDSDIDISMERIINTTKDIVEKYLEEYLIPIGTEKNKKIENYVIKKAPEFRHLLKYMPDDIKKIKPNLSEEKLDDELHQIKRKFDKQIKSDNEKILEQLKTGAVGFEEYEQTFHDQVSKVSEANGAVLAEYIAHRKVIIDLLEVGIRKNDGGKFNKESFMHTIFYPMKTTSDDVDYNSHNLWLIDERLAYSNYICSDIPFDHKENKERADILMLDSPVAVAEVANNGQIFNSITIFELKRPMRDDYTRLENPINQMYDYVDKIQSGKIKDINGRKIPVNNSTKYYLYAICDDTDSLKKILKQNSFRSTPDGMGYYSYNDEYPAYVEVLPYDKIILSAKQRNKILFDKLGI